MELTQTELEIVGRMRRRRLTWRRTRWIVLTGGICLGTVWSCLFVKAADALDSTKASLEANVYSLVIVTAMGGWVLSGVLIGLALRNWRGNPTQTLLLRLIDAAVGSSNGEKKSNP
jgi:hypothetical protein